MKKFLTTFYLFRVIFLNFLLSGLIWASIPAKAQTDCTANFAFTGGLQSWTVPNGITSIRIEAAGAKGGNENYCSTNCPQGGLGATVTGDFVVTPGEVFQIIVAGKGKDYPVSAGGGGATFIARGNSGFSDFTASNILLIGGGGGGANFLQGNGQSSTVFQASAVGSGGTNGGNRAGGGGSAEENGQSSDNEQGGRAAINGAAGGISYSNGGNGGFGGGGAGRLGGGGGGGATGGNSGRSAGEDRGLAGTSYNGGSNPVNSSASNAGNGYVIISYNDIIPPVAICQNMDVYLNIYGLASLDPENVDDGSTDNCGVASMTVIPNTFDCTDIADNPHMVTLTVFDTEGNSASCEAQIMVQDTTPPSFTCPSNHDINLNANCVLVMPNLIDGLMGTDNCGTVSFSQNPTAGTMVGSSHNSIVFVTITANDGNGNSSECTVTLTAKDMIAPNVECFDQTIIFNGEDSFMLHTEDLVDTDDNCGVQNINLSSSIISSNQVGQTVPILVTVTDLTGNSSTCMSQVSVDGLPTGWSQEPDGVGCVAGNNIDYNANNGIWTATSTNCFYTPPFTSDGTAFAQYSLCGNGSITAQVTGLTGTSLGWAGVVMRETNAPGAKKAQLTTNMSNFSRREFRTTTNGAAFPQQFPSQNRRWLRIVRSGNQFAMYVSHNGVNWAFAGGRNIQMNSCIEIGLVASNYSSNSTVTATFANVSVTGSNSLSLISDGDPTLARTHDQQNLRDVKVFPNPTSGQLNIALNGYEARSVTLEIFNTMGQILYIKEIDEVQNANEIIDLSSVASGMYLIRISSDGLPAEMKRVTVAR